MEVKAERSSRHQGGRRFENANGRDAGYNKISLKGPGAGRLQGDVCFWTPLEAEGVLPQLVPGCHAGGIYEWDGGPISDRDECLRGTVALHEPLDRCFWGCASQCRESGLIGQLLGHATRHARCLCLHQRPVGGAFAQDPDWLHGARRTRRWEHRLYRGRWWIMTAIVFH